MTEDIRNRLPGKPFLPFTVSTTDGRNFTVPTPDHAHVHPNRLRVSFYTDEGREFILPAHPIRGLELGCRDGFIK